jgi:hypothetical protein
MIDPTGQQIVQQVHPSWFDWLTVLAIVVGPILALLTQRLLDWIREKKQRRVQLYLTVMSLRATWLHPDSVRALNSIDTIFDGESDSDVRKAWSAVIAFARTPQPDFRVQRDQALAWNDHLVDLRVDLYQLLGVAVGYNHTVDYIKTQFYNPQLHQDIEQELSQIRKQFAKAITDDGLKVVLMNQPGN